MPGAIPRISCTIGHDRNRCEQASERANESAWFLFFGFVLQPQTPHCQQFTGRLKNVPRIFACLLLLHFFLSLLQAKLSPIIGLSLMRPSFFAYPSLLLVLLGLRLASRHKHSLSDSLSGDFHHFHFSLSLSLRFFCRLFSFRTISVRSATVRWMALEPAARRLHFRSFFTRHTRNSPTHSATTGLGSAGTGTLGFRVEKPIMM